MNILIFGSSSTNRSPDQQGQAELLLSLGHKVFLLTLGEDDILHKNFRALGAEAFSSAHVKGKSLFFFINQARYLAKFCNLHKIDLVFCHLPGNAVIGGLAKYLMKTKVVYVRHHTDEFKVLKSKKNVFISNAANALSPRIIAISNKVKEELLKDGVNQEKIYRINLCYNFDQFLVSDVKGDPAVIRQKVNASFILLCISRLVQTKRQLLAFEAIKQLNEKGFSCGLICVGTGNMQRELSAWIKKNRLEDKIILEGFKANISDYILAADMLIQPSYSEASNQVVKEGGLLRKPAIVCQGVGDFDDYILHNQNSFIVGKENPLPETVALLSELINDKAKISRVGNALYETVLSTFSFDMVKEKYADLIHEKKYYN